MQRQSAPYLSNQLPTTLEDRSPPSCTLSLRQRSWPLKMDHVVHLTSPSLVSRQLPVTTVSTRLYLGARKITVDVHFTS